MSDVLSSLDRCGFDYYSCWYMNVFFYDDCFKDYQKYIKIHLHEGSNFLNEILYKPELRKLLLQSLKGEILSTKRYLKY